MNETLKLSNEWGFVMTFKQLEYLIAIVEHDTFFNAAEAVNITQSALSKQIMKLEQELDVRLFDRRKRNAILTEAGKIFYEEALILDRQYRLMLAKMQEHQSKLQQTLRIGTLPILMQYDLTPRLYEYKLRHPEIDLKIDEVEEEALMNGFEQGTYDLIIAREHMLTPQKYMSWLLTVDELAVILPKDHPLAGDSRPVFLKSLASERFMLMNRYTSVYRLCMELFDNSRLSPDILRTARPESLISAVSAGEGISLLPKGTFEIFNHHGAVALALSPSVPLRVMLAKRKDQKTSSAMKTLIRYFTG